MAPRRARAECRARPVACRRNTVDLRLGWPTAPRPGEPRGSHKSADVHPQLPRHRDERGRGNVDGCGLDVLHGARLDADPFGKLGLRETPLPAQPPHVRGDVLQQLLSLALPHRNGRRRRRRLEKRKVFLYLGAWRGVLPRLARKFKPCASPWSSFRSLSLSAARPRRHRRGDRHRTPAPRAFRCRGRLAARRAAATHGS